VILRLTHARLENRVRSQRHTQQAKARIFLRLHLPTAIAHQNYVAILLEQTGYALVVANTSINQTNHALRVQLIQRQRLKQSGYAG
jgi:hypothetical protein